MSIPCPPPQEDIYTKIENHLKTDRTLVLFSPSLSSEETGEFVFSAFNLDTFRRTRLYYYAPELQKMEDDWDGLASGYLCLGRAIIRNLAKSPPPPAAPQP